MSRCALARRLAELVDADEAIAAVVTCLEEARRRGRGGQIRWHIDDLGQLAVVDFGGTLYRRGRGRSTMSPGRPERPEPENESGGV